MLSATIRLTHVKCTANCAIAFHSLYKVGIQTLGRSTDIKWLHCQKCVGVGVASRREARRRDRLNSVNSMSLIYSFCTY